MNHSSLEIEIFAVLIAMLVVVMILFVLFGQVTVRKLRKNPETKDKLGMEFVSGMDITNVAWALSAPAWYIALIKRKSKDKPQLSFLFANSELLVKHTNRFDRVLGRIFFWLLMTTGSSLIALMLLSKLGVFD